MNLLRVYDRESNPDFKFLKSSFARSFEAAVSLNPKKIFVVVYGDGGARVEKTFEDFRMDVGRIRVRLKGSAPVVATIAGNTYAHLVYVTAILLETKTLCPMNPSDDPARIHEKLEQISGSVTAIYESDMQIPSDGPTDLSVGGNFIEPMIFIFTSGSTGFSKIVEQNESAVLSNVDALIERHHLSRAATIATPLPVFHVNALEFSFFSCLLSGNCFVLFEKFDLAQICEAVRRDRIEILSVVPHLLAGFLQWCKSGELNGLRYIVTAAAPLGRDLAQGLINEFPIPCLQGYGLSEAVNFSCLMPSDLSLGEYRHWMTEFAHPSVGTELRGNSMHILGQDGRELGEGQIGEIGVRGWNVMRGYRGDISNQIFDGGYLRTGDLGYFHTDEIGRKFFFISGRIKDVIKRNAMTVSLAEVDQCLQRLGLDAIAVGFEHDIAGEELAAVLFSSVPPTSEDLKNLAHTIDTQFSETLRPRVLAWTSQPIRTSSGKPQRWKFRSGLKHFSSMLLRRTTLIYEIELRFDDTSD